MKEWKNVPMPKPFKFFSLRGLTLVVFTITIQEILFSRNLHILLRWKDNWKKSK